jgi:glutaredoxin-like YruB-family protein
MTIKVYSTPTCPYCKLVKEFLQEKHIPFTDIDVAADAEAAKEMVKLSGQMGVPVVDIAGQIIVGWNKNALEETINTQKAREEKAPTKTV